ncbi:AsnC family protein [Paracoccus nototheniae]|uniref:AsnC family protein n=1 Tax=Paracoccus nototheniae TaxID=2489002 RepID=A0ABW4DXF0_9RHOB|nr:AsnC family protein [Paracoccus nototheniae]
MNVQASNLDMDKLRKVRALMAGGKTDGERRAAMSKAEALAARAGLTLQAALSRLDAPSAKPANMFTGFDDWMEAKEPGYKVKEAARRADKEAQRRARCRELLAEYGSEDAVFAPTDTEAALRDALAHLADADNPFWGYRGFKYCDGPTDAMWQAMRGAVRVPETVQAAWATHQAHEARTAARCTFEPGYTSHEWEEAWRSALEHLLDNLRTPTAQGITARLDWMDYLANLDMARGADADRALIAALRADFATFVAPVQSGRPSTADRRAEVLTVLQAEPSLSDRAIARRVGCSPQTVGNIRRGMAA